MSRSSKLCLDSSSLKCANPSCKEPFYPNPAKPNQRFCNPDCQRIYQRRAYDRARHKKLNQAKKALKMSFIYIASPYTHQDSYIREQRYVQASYYVVHLLSQHKFPYSPIVSNHHLALEFNLKRRAIDWMAYNFTMLSVAKELHVLTLPGWQESLGVQAEINFWRASRPGENLLFIDLTHQKLLGETALCAPAKKDG